LTLVLSIVSSLVTLEPASAHQPTPASQPATSQPAAPAASPAATGTGVVDGVVVDAQSGLPLPGAAVSVVGLTVSIVSDGKGMFQFAALPAGQYKLHVEHVGYQPTVSDSVTLINGEEARVTLALQRVASGTQLRTIANTSTKASQSLQRSSVIYRTLSPEALAQVGIYRAGDALRLEPGVNNGITGDTASLSDDINLSIRGIGTLETTTTLDGHAIGYGIPGGYNYQLSPVMGLRDIAVTYGSGGSNLLGVDAIGGVVDFQTINPTPETHLSFQQGYGSFDRLTSNFSYTGTSNKFGYALDLGVSGLDGPFKNSYPPNPGAAFDPSAPVGSASYPLYLVDSSASAKTALFKLRYNLSPITTITATSTNSSFWENKTGNGDGDFLPYPAALAFGNLGLKNKPSTDPCPAGTFQVLNQFGVPGGTGVDGKPDGGVPCQTPQQYAHYNTGFDGAGVAWQAINFNDQHVVLESTPDDGKQDFRLDMYANRYLDTVDRTFQLPQQPGGAYQPSWRNSSVVEAGAILSDDTYTAPSNRLGVGFGYLNSSYEFSRNAKPTGNPNIADADVFLRDVFHPIGSPLAFYGTAYLKTSTATVTAPLLDPRLAIVYTPNASNVFRFAEGATSTEPAGNEVDVPFVESPVGGAGGGKPVNCSTFNSIGSAPSTTLQPERGVDTELSYAHRWFADSTTQLELYNVNVYDKLYSSLIPLSQSGVDFIPPDYLQSQALAVASKCSISQKEAVALLGLSGTVNIGQLQARGFTFSGRQRFDKRTFIDYVWDLDSTVLKSVPTNFLQSNLTDIVGSQLPSLPLHTLTATLDHNFGRGIDARYTLHTVSVNNTKSLPAYNFSDLSVSAPVSSGTFAVSVSNLFSQYANIEGLRYQGVPLPLNQYATAADYAPYTGANATEWFGLPYRMIFVNYTFQTK
jgi:hypothetical protein